MRDGEILIEHLYNKTWQFYVTSNAMELFNESTGGLLEHEG